MNTKEIEDDFNRDIWCLLGLPFDAVSIESASEHVFGASAKNKRCVISTPNLNFIVTAIRDSDFRNTVISSEMSLLDGMPLLWVARLLGLGITEKVSGSDLFDFICEGEKRGNKNLCLFFFGGEKKAAKQACKNVNTGNKGVSCAGYLDPGFGPVEMLSNPEFITEINNSQSDFLIVALGARKGQLWIDQNRTKLNTPVICHLGAVINFIAGKVSRAPRWMQKFGLEWLWRIYQEPVLWWRYLFDGLAFIKLLLSRVIPYIIWKKLNSRELANSQPPSCQIEADPGRTAIKIKGNCVHGNLDPIRKVFLSAARNGGRIELDLSEVSLIDGAFLGLCQILLKYTECCGGKLIIREVSPALRRIVYWNCAEYLL